MLKKSRQVSRSSDSLAMSPIETLIRSNEQNLVQKDANEAILTTLRVVINTPHPEPELICFTLQVQPQVFRQ